MVKNGFVRNFFGTGKIKSQGMRKDESKVVVDSSRRYNKQNRVI